MCFRLQAPASLQKYLERMYHCILYQVIVHSIPRVPTEHLKLRKAISDNLKNLPKQVFQLFAIAIFILPPLNHTKIRHGFNLKCFCPLPTVHPNRYHVHMSPNRTQGFLKLSLSIVPCYSPGEGGHDQHSLCRQTSRFERSCSSTEETGPVGEPTISIQVENMQKAISLSFGTIHQP